MWVTENYGFRCVEFEVLMAYPSRSVQEAVVGLEFRREDRTGGQNLGVLSTENATKTMVLHNITQGEGAE